MSSLLIEPAELCAAHPAVIFDCRFSLAEPQAGRALYRQGHIPGAYYLHLEEDLSGAVGRHGGRHPLPEPAQFGALLARHGVGPETAVIAYDDNRLAFASRLWWLLRSAGYRPPRLLNGGYSAWLAAGGQPASGDQPEPLTAAAAGPLREFTGCCDIDGLRTLQSRGAVLVDSREAARYQGLEEPIDPVAGHIPGALNKPWQGVTDGAGRVQPEAVLRQHWAEELAAEELVVYCGSGVTACVNLFSLALLGRNDATLYAGSWSDWCSYLQ
jgi:thiosulfate/3-mercaptopyruvate sulfurtransferase